MAWRREKSSTCRIVDVLSGKTVAGYGAPGKGNTLLNYCGIRTDFIDYTVDRNPYKQGKYTPGTRIPILTPETIRATRPDYIFVLPWNLADEITALERSLVGYLAGINSDLRRRIRVRKTRGKWQTFEHHLRSKETGQ